MIEKNLFCSFNGQDVYLYILHGSGIEVGVIEFGAAIKFIRMQTKTGIKSVALDYQTIEELLKSGTFCGATIGRVANRIAGAKFTLNGREYNLSANEGKNCNHGGVNGFDKKLFKSEVCGDILRLTLLSPDGDQGFPGNLTLTVEYELKDKTLEIRYSALSDKDTLWSPTSHVCFNLNGEGSGDIFDTVLKINAEKVTLSDIEHIATGETAYVVGTPFDFTQPRAIGSAINADNEQLKWSGGYDQNYVLTGEHAATAYSNASRLKLDVYTDLPGLQFYSGNYLNGRYSPRDGFCLEPQYFPNAINIENFESPILKANELKTHYVHFKFSLLN